MKKKVCKSCQIFVEGSSCPICKKSQFSTNWQGRVHVLDPQRSIVAGKIGIKVKGEYVIKVK